ncbi:zinc finger, CCHC-type containing protein [Tanacetum coccineum]
MVMMYLEQTQKMDKWDNDDYVCRGLILNGMSGSLFDIYQSVESSKELWDSLEAKYMAKDASSKNFLVSNFTNYKMTDSRPIMEQYNELLGILERFTQHKMNMDEAIQVSCIIDKLPPSWKDFKHTLKHLKEELTLVELGSHLRIEESLRVQDDDVTWWVDSGATIHVCKDRCCFKTYESLNDGSILHMGNKSTTLVYGRGYVYFRFSSGKIVLLFNVLHVPNIRKNLVSSCILNNCGYKQVMESNKFVLSKHSVFIGFGYLSNQMFMLNIDNDNIASAFMSTSKLNDSILWHARLSHVHFKRMQDMSKDGLILAFNMDTKKTESRVLGAVVRLPVPKLKTLGEKGIECIFVGYAKHSKAFRFYVIEPNESVLINYIIESMYEIFDENRFSSVPRPILRIPNRTKDIGGLVVPQEVTEEVVTQQPEPELRKGKRNRTPNNFGPEFQLCLIEGTRDDVFDQHSYFLNIEDDPKTFDEAMKSQDVAIWKEAFNDEMDSIMGNNTWVLADLPLGIDYFDTYAPVARISTIRLLIAMASIHNLIIHQMDVKTAFLNGELDEEVYMNQPQGFIMSGNENKDIGEADVILGIRIKHESNRIAISQSHYIEKVLKKFNYFYCTPVSTPMDTSEKLMPNNGQAVSQLEYSRVIGCLMYAMTCTRPAIAFVVGKLSSVGRYMMQVRSATLKTIRLPVAGYSCLVEVQFLRLLRNKLASLVQ